jgi:hypothetical protein
MVARAVQLGASTGIGASTLALVFMRSFFPIIIALQKGLWPKHILNFFL